MPYKRRDPVPIEEMDRSRYDGHFSICQFIRDMYQLMDSPEEHRNTVKLKLRIAMAMAKAMNAKIQWYKHRDEEAQRQSGG